MSFLVTGGTGTFGKNFTRYMLNKFDKDENFFEDRIIVIYSRSEYSQEIMRQEFDDTRVKFVLGDILDSDKLTKTINKFDVSYLVHAAAVKRIETAEKDPSYCHLNNVTGTRRVLTACLQAHKSPRAVFLSTDKSVEPTTVYGASKMVAERLWMEAAKNMPLSVVRYGNVIGSRGSVLEIFEKCKYEDKPLPVTSLEMTRFFLPIQTAIEIVVEALFYRESNHLFIPFIKAFYIEDLVKAFIECYKEDSKEEIIEGKDYVVIGEKPYEKLHEKMVYDYESFVLKRTDNGTQYLISSTDKEAKKYNSYNSLQWQYRMTVKELIRIIVENNGA